MSKRPLTDLRALLPAIALLLGACSGTPERAPLPSGGSAHRIELTDVPFFPQDRYQCGPAALATVLRAAGADATPDDLVPQVYLPAREGSLQPELLAAVRRGGRLPYVIPPRLDALFAELDAGRPVAVLQNLGFGWLPQWHYAVAVGYDREAETLVLRSGTERRHVVATETFDRTWARSGRWGFVVLEPGRLPAALDRALYVDAAAGLESAGKAAAAELAYRAGLERWPADPDLLFGTGNARYLQRDPVGAERIFADIVRRHPGFAPAHNNLAVLLARRGETATALNHAERAVALAPGNAEYRATLSDIRARPSAD